MGTITITTENHETYSAVSNFFIDYYMTEANGEFVKVYLYLVRLLNSGQAVTVADIADHFNLSPATISVYLKEGNDIGWCKYNKTSFSRKQIYVYDSYKNCIGIFDDAQNLSKHSSEFLGKYISKKEE